MSAGKRRPSSLIVAGPLSRLVRAARLRWPVEEDFRSGKGCFGLDQSQVRLFTAIARHTVLVIAALRQPPAVLLLSQAPEREAAARCGTDMLIALHRRLKAEWLLPYYATDRH